MWFSLFLLAILFCLLAILSFIWPPDSPWSPRWRTKRKVAREVLKFVNLSKKDVLYELGSGDGEVVLSAVQDFGAKAVGIEIDPVRYLVSVIRVWLARLENEIKLIRKDFKKVNLSSATVVYLYLVPAGMARLLPQFKKELKKGTLVISYRYEVPHSDKSPLKLFKKDMKNGYFVYKII